MVRISTRQYVLLSSILIVLGVLCIAMIIHALPSNPSPGISLANMNKSVYEWRSFNSLNTSTYMQKLNQLKQNGYNQMYLSLLDFPGLLQSPTSTSQKNITNYSSQLSSFLNNVHQVGFKVQALGGDPSWVSPSDRHLNNLLLQYVIDYNNDPSHQVKFVGIQYDNEPWSLPDFDANYSNQVSQYLDTVKSVINYNGLQAAPANFAIGFTLPFSFTNLDNTIKPVNYNGVSNYAAYQTLDILNSRPYTYVSFLDYRNNTKGSDGSVAHAQSLLNYAKTNAHNASVVISQEVNNVLPPKVTFYGLGYSKLENNMLTISNAYANNPQFRGFAVNDAQGLTNLLATSH